MPRIRCTQPQVVMSATIAPWPPTTTTLSLRIPPRPQRASSEPTMNIITPANAAHPESPRRVEPDASTLDRVERDELHRCSFHDRNRGPIYTRRPRLAHVLPVTPCRRFCAPAPTGVIRVGPKKSRALLRQPGGFEGLRLSPTLPHPLPFRSGAAGLPSFVARLRRPFDW